MKKKEGEGEIYIVFVAWLELCIPTWLCNSKDFSDDYNGHVCVLLFSCVHLFVTLYTVARQARLSMGILQARILEWVAMPSSRGSSQPRDQTQVSCIAGGFFTV